MKRYVTSFSAHDLEDLQEFVELVMSLRNSAFARRVLSAKEISYRRVGNQSEGEFVNFDEDECRSFILGCRLLMQNNDRASIQRVWTMFHEKPRESVWFVRLNPPRWALNDFLDTNAVIAAPGGKGASVTNRLILETFLYGSYAHINREHRKRFKEWELDLHQFPHVKLWFMLSLQVLFKSSNEMADVVAEWLLQHQKENHQ